MTTVTSTKPRSLRQNIISRYRYPETDIWESFLYLSHYIHTYGIKIILINNIINKYQPQYHSTVTVIIFKITNYYFYDKIYKLNYNYN